MTGQPRRRALDDLAELLPDLLRLASLPAVQRARIVRNMRPELHATLELVEAQAVREAAAQLPPAGRVAQLAEGLGLPAVAVESLIRRGRQLE